MDMKFISKSEIETYKFAKKLAKKLKGGEIIGLVGDLGAGKTVFVRGLAAGLEIKQKITSPTFVLMKIYKAGGKKIKQLCHIDAYRLKSARDILAIGADEYFSQPDTVTAIEWAEKIKKNLPPKTKFMKFKIKNDLRIINLK